MWESDERGCKKNFPFKSAYPFGDAGGEELLLYRMTPIYIYIYTHIYIYIYMLYIYYIYILYIYIILLYIYKSITPNLQAIGRFVWLW